MFSVGVAKNDGPDIAGALQPYVDRGELAGAVTLVVSKDRVLDLEAIGYADIAAKKPMRPDTLFWVASMSKPITAAALMMLVDEGRVHLDDPVERYLPDFKPHISVASAADGSARAQEPSQPITLRLLLNHSSGLAFSSSIETPTFDLQPLAVRVQSYASEPLKYEPGSSALYSNEGINVAARVVEVVSGMPFADFLEKRIFKPLGMKDTTFWPTSAQLARLAKSYSPAASGTGLQETVITQLRYPLNDRTHRFPVPAGGLFSTAADMGVFCQMFLNKGSMKGKRYLSEASIREMTRNQRQPVDGVVAEEGYGLGWGIKRGGIYEHGGAYATHMTVDPRNGLARVWLIQHANGFPGNGKKGEETFDAAVTEYYVPGLAGTR